MTTTLSWDSAADEIPPDDDAPIALQCPEPGCDFSTISSSGLKRHMTRTHGAEPSGHSPAGSGAPETSGPESPPVAEETPPSPPRIAPRGGLLGRLKGRLRSGKSGGGPSAPRTPKAPRAATGRGKRIPIASDISDAYFGLGRQLEYTPHFPAGRMLTYQAPAAGVILDEALAGTILDAFVVQPIWRAKDKWEDVVYLTAPPVLLILIQNLRIRAQAALAAGDVEQARKLDGMAQFEMGMLARMLRSSMLKLAPAMAEARKRAEEEDQIIREAFPELPPGEDPVQVLLSSLFTPPGAPSQPEEADNVGDVYVQ